MNANSSCLAAFGPGDARRSPGRGESAKTSTPIKLLALARRFRNGNHIQGIMNSGIQELRNVERWSSDE
jgi:hypothetical protein